MGDTVLYVLNQKSLSFVEEYENSYGSAPTAWDFLSRKYLGLNNYPTSWDKENSKKLWALAYDESVEIDERVVLLMTFDFAYVPMNYLAEAGDLCERFATRITDDRVENHWANIGKGLRTMASTRFSRFARGSCLTLSTSHEIWKEKGNIAKAWSIFG